MNKRNDLSPEELRFFGEKFEPAWDAVDRACTDLGRITAAEAMLAGHASGEEPLSEEALNSSQLELRAAKRDFGFSSTTAGFYAKMEGNVNPLTPGNIAKRPGTRGVSEEPEFAPKTRRQPHGTERFDTPQSRIRLALDMRRAKLQVHPKRHLNRKSI